MAKAVRVAIPKSLKLISCVLKGSETSSAFPGTDGGRPMMLDGKMVLCSHSDPTFNRHYNGGIAQLSIYDSALQPAEVRALYNQVSCGLQAATQLLQSWRFGSVLHQGHGRGAAACKS